ncbi:hypothetical protein LOZ57_006929 [Ophidiomyces ophidiicola]|uniref:uncharacterized protein n=1 Tax=Ophidiomyces ophidiicola TaxID=1387563 RepID=UPI0020C4B46B|nr:uncharacterized protein LOZ57_006929 [Ophidiomyces ophidiicola]KAI1934879.1 hypothetical protein LOZ57_006929 [Ophidiomyces ophidiicola]KAI2047942.1 hypothetical protein LOZ43_005517 [Ophidiomyces ophidiicola]KAI2077987.1 hypothetical protein LOZ36_006865 [Ophidiomyces ophidiicola]
MEGQSESEQKAGSKANQIEIRQLSEELKGLVDARQKWLASTTHFVKQGDVYLNIDKTFKQEFKVLIDKLNHPQSAQVSLFRTEDNNKPTRVHDSRLKRILYIYPLHISDGLTKVHSEYPGSPGSISKEIRVGTSVVFRDHVFIDGVLNFLMIGVPREDAEHFQHTNKEGMAEERNENPK